MHSAGRETCAWWWSRVRVRGERTVSLRSDSWDSRGEACLATHVLMGFQDMSVGGIERASWSLEACECGLWRRATGL